MFWAGYLGDKTNLWLARRRGGTHLPEDSLISLIVPTIVSGIGILIYALSTNSPTKYSSWGVIMGKSHYHVTVLPTSTNDL
jgi:ABC-type spermidine/putrescine transport system permease subunit II